MTIQRSDIEKLAELARIQISEENITATLTSLGNVLQLVDQLQAADTTSIAPMAHPLDAVQRPRPDTVTEPNRRDAFQAIPPATENGLHLVPQVLEAPPASPAPPRLPAAPPPQARLPPMHHQPLAQLSAGLASGEFSSVELARHFLDRIQRLDATYNAFITVTGSEALQSAAAADARRASGDAVHPLCGVPIAHKDIFCTEGVRTSCASKMLDNFVPPYNATVVENFLAAGAVVLGKTNMDEFAMGSSNETSWYGPV